MARAGDPGDEDVVGVVDEVVARQRVDQFAAAVEVSTGDRHELAIASGRGDVSGALEEAVAVGGEERRGDEDGRVVAGARRLDDRRDRLGVAGGEPVDEVFGGRHAATVEEGADTALTPP